MIDDRKLARPERNPSQDAYGKGRRLIGKNYKTADLLAKVTGRAKYAEDFRAEGMLFCRLVLSPLPHARIRRIHTDAALAVPGVKAILTAGDIPEPAASRDGNGNVVKASKWRERALTDEPMYVGDPILAVAAVDELACAEAIEKIEIDFERLPFVLDPLETLRPGGPNPHEDGNAWVTPAGPQPQAPQLREIKWTEAEFAEYDSGKLPMGDVPDQWSYGNLDDGFRDAALILDETFMTPGTEHQCLEPRTTMAYWQNGKLILHTGAQSTGQTVAAIAELMNMPEKDIVFISEYTGGGFGGKIRAGVTMIIPALLSRKLGVPVMMRISREEEHSIGRARTGVAGRLKIGFAADGKILALDMFTISNSGSYDAQFDGLWAAKFVSLLYQPRAMRQRAISVMTNTLPRQWQTSPGGLPCSAFVEPILSKAARRLGIDQVAMRRVNCPEGKVEYGPPVEGRRAYATSCFLKEALDRGAEQFRWSERVQENRRSGSRVRGLGVALSAYDAGTTGYDGLLVITPEGRVQFQSGIANLGTESTFDAFRAAAEKLGVPWEICDITWGNTSKHLPYTCVAGGSRTINTMSRASWAVAEECAQRLKEIAALTHGGDPADYRVGNQRVFRKGGGAGLSFAQAAKRAIELGGIYDGHEVNPDVNRATRLSVAGLAGQGLVVSARDKYPCNGDPFSYLACFAEVEVDIETGKYAILDLLASADVGTVIHPAALGGQILGRITLGIGHAIGQKMVYDPHSGAPVAKRFYQNKPPTILDVPNDMQWDALDIPDPETPVGARGVGETPVGSGCAAILNALADAVGDEVFTRAPVNSDTILASLEAGHPTQHPLMAFI
ncbi:MAG: xanthine dehydrogenase family protein molybdopterin-binding subunit [Terracidiphilus sp.]